MKILHVLLFWCLVLVEAQEEGDRCRDSRGVVGKYKNINSCPILKKWLERQTELRVFQCGTTNILFCCTNLKSCLPVTKKFPTTNKSPAIKKHGELSAKKCQEYYLHPPTQRVRRALTGPGVNRPMTTNFPEFPHMAIIGKRNSDHIEWICGGSLISHNFVLTAAHCLKSEHLTIRLGDLDISTDTDVAAPQQFKSKKLFIHPDYKRPAKYHDIGLIELERNVKLSRFVSIACLDTRGDSNTANLLATGWGQTKLFGSLSSHLLKVNLEVVPHNVCETSYRKDVFLPFGIIDDGQICAGGRSGNNACVGDSGGPLQLRNEEVLSLVPVYYIVGVTSYGKPCVDLSKIPGVFTRVNNYVPWIESIVWY